MTDCELDQAMSQALRSLDLARFDQLATEADRRRVALDDKLSQPGALLAAALWYAEQGMPVFPCAVGGKRPLTKHGLHDATTDLEQIRRWWTSVPQANIGLPTGHRYDVIDIDPPDGSGGTGSHGARSVTSQPPTRRRSGIRWWTAGWPSANGGRRCGMVGR